MGILAITSMLMLVGNIVSDICVALVDPACGSESEHEPCHLKNSSVSNRSSAVTTPSSSSPPWCCSPLLAELLVNSRALMVSYQGSSIFPPMAT